MYGTAERGKTGAMEAGAHTADVHDDFDYGV